MRILMIRARSARLLAMVSAVLLAVSLVGVIAASTLPAEVKSETALVNYQHNGEFDYLITLKPSYLFGPEPQQPLPPPPPPPQLSNLKYPIDMLDRFDFTFAYRFVSDKPVTKVSAEVKATATVIGIQGKAQEITLLPMTSKTGDFTISFPLAITESILGGDITIRVDVYPAIQAENSVTFESFTQSLSMRLKPPLIEVERTLDYSASGNSGGLIYEQKGNLAYTVLLKSGSPFGAITLAPPRVVAPALPRPSPSLPPKTIGPGETVFTKLVDKIDASFHYEFKSDKRVRDLSEEVKITAVLENPKVWSKSFVLVPPTGKQGNFTINFPVDLNQFANMLELIRTETGVAAESYTLTIKADVHTVGQTDFGEINEVFSQTLSTSSLGKGTLEWNEKLAQSNPGAIKVNTVIPNPNQYLGLSVSGVMGLSIGLAGVFFLFCLFSVVMYVRVRPARPSLIKQEAQRINKKYGQRIAEATAQTPVEGEKIISLGSMEDLMKIADELGKPVIHQALGTSEDPHAYHIFDGATRYQYLLVTGGQGQNSDAKETE